MKTVQFGRSDRVPAEASGIQVDSSFQPRSVYSSKAFNELLPMYEITCFMSRAGTPTDNATMESINVWIKAEMFMDLHDTVEKSVQNEIDDYIVLFNEQRPAYSLGYPVNRV